MDKSQSTRFHTSASRTNDKLQELQSETGYNEAWVPEKRPHAKTHPGIADWFSSICLILPLIFRNLANLDQYFANPYTATLIMPSMIKRIQTMTFRKRGDSPHNNTAQNHESTMELYNKHSANREAWQRVVRRGGPLKGTSWRWLSGRPTRAMSSLQVLAGAQAGTMEGLGHGSETRDRKTE